MATESIERVVVFVQENHTVDNYFRDLAAYGANVVSDWPVTPTPPVNDPPHDRHAYFRWLTEGKAARLQFETTQDIPYYLYLATTGAFLENHCSGFGTNSTPNHLILVGGQTPTLKNPSSREAEPVWDMPSVMGLAEENGVSWRCYAGNRDYPVGFYKQLRGSPNIVHSSQFLKDAVAGRLPSLVYVWHNSPFDEHPRSNVTEGMKLIWQSVDAIISNSGWEKTVFLLTWDDWGGFDDHVATPATEYTPDNVQLAYGPRVPLLMFGGHVKPGIDSRWCSHASVPKTVMQLLKLPPLGVPRADGDAGLADLVDLAMQPNPQPPAYEKEIPIPKPPTPTPAPRATPPAPVKEPLPVGPVLLRGGSQLPPPDDVTLPAQPAPPKEPFTTAPSPPPVPPPPPVAPANTVHGGANVVVVNESTVLSDADTAKLVAALQQQVSTQFGPAWATDAQLGVLPRGATVPTGAWILHLLDDTDQETALGYHDEEGNEVPFARVFCRTAQQNGSSPSEVASHELLEMLADPHLSAAAVDLEHNRLYGWEVGDPCQGNGYDVGAPTGNPTGTIVADFALPAWMDPKTPVGAPTDYRGALRGPFALCPTGYVAYLDLTEPGKGWQQQLGHARARVPLELDDRPNRRTHR